MTAQDYVDQVMTMCETEYATLSLDTGSVLHFVNIARVDVFNFAAEMYPQLNTVKKAGANPMTLADSDLFFRENGVVKDPGGALPYVSCRKVAWQEEKTVIGSSYVAPASYDPIYTIKKYTINVLPAAGSLFVYYLKTPAWFTALTDTEDAILASMYELVIRRAVLAAYEKLGMTSAMEAVKADFAQQADQWTKNVNAADENVRTFLQSAMSMQNLN